MMPTETTDNNAMSGLENILYAAIDYHQSKLSCFSDVTNTSASTNDSFFMSKWTILHLSKIPKQTSSGSTP